MISFDEYTNENKRKYNPNWPYFHIILAEY